MGTVHTAMMTWTSVVLRMGSNVHVYVATCVCRAIDEYGYGKPIENENDANGTEAIGHALYSSVMVTLAVISTQIDLRENRFALDSNVTAGSVVMMSETLGC